MTTPTKPDASAELEDLYKRGDLHLSNIECQLGWDSAVRDIRLLINRLKKQNTKLKEAYAARWDKINELRLVIANVRGIDEESIEEIAHLKAENERLTKEYAALREKIEGSPKVLLWKHDDGSLDLQITHLAYQSKQWTQHEYYALPVEQSEEDHSCRKTSVRDALRKHGLDDGSTQSGVDEVDLRTGKIRSEEKKNAES